MSEQSAEETVLRTVRTAYWGNREEANAMSLDVIRRLEAAEARAERAEAYILATRWDYPRGGRQCRECENHADRHAPDCYIGELLARRA